MSLIASFYLINLEAIPGLLAGDWPPRYDYLTAHGYELERYPWSGYILAIETLHVLEKHGIWWEDYSDRELSAELVNLPDLFATGTFAFRHLGASDLVKRLKAVTLTEAKIREILADEMIDDLEAVLLEAVPAGIAILITWLSKVDDEYCGILSFG